MTHFLTSMNSTASNVVIGPMNEDDHQSRLEECKSFFANHTLSSHTSLIANIRCFLFDRWSVIRFQCYKSLVKLVPSLALETIQTLIHSLQQDFLERSRPWQELHGCLLGYDAVISQVFAQETLMHSLILDCLEVIGHIRNPIRDAAKDCIVKIGSYPIYRQQIVPQMLDLIRSLLPNHQHPISSSGVKTSSNNTNVDSEANTLKIDGLLNVIVDLVPRMKEEITTSSSSSTIPTNENKTYYSLESLSLTMKQCFFHPASTVRQKAGNIITSMVKLLLLEQDSTPSNSQATQAHFAYLIENVLIHSLHQKAVDQWQGQEVCLIVCEEILRDVTNQYFQHLLSNDKLIGADNVWLQKVDILHQLMLVLQHLVHYFLAHPRFEVRRVILQLLPTIARAKIILPPKSSTNSSNNPLNHNSNMHHVDLAASKISFEIMLDMVWLSIYMKEYRHLHEVMHPTQPLNTVQLPLSSIFGAEYWSNEVHGRLLEVELRQDFHKQIEQVFSKANCVPCIKSLKDSLTRSSQEIISLLQVHLNQLESISSLTSVPNYVSIDFIEFFALSKAFLFSLHHRSNLHFFENGQDILKEVVALEERVEKYSMSWYTTLSFLQLNSVLQSAASNAASTGSQKSSSHLPQNVFSFGNSSSAIRPTATEFIIMFLYKYRVNTKHKAEIGDDSTWLNLKCYLGEFELEEIRLLPTLTDPATNPLIYTEENTSETSTSSTIADSSSSSNNSSAANMTSPQRTTLRVQVSSRESSFYMNSLTPSTSARDIQVMSSLLSPGISAKSPSITSPNRVGVGCNVPVNTSMASYHSMNRWNCEAISPLLYMLSCQLHLQNQIEDTLLLACITGEWLINIMLDPLWLDNRKFARRVLMESIPILVTMVCQSVEVENPVESDIYQVMLLYLSRTMAEILTIESKQMAMDIRLLGPILKSSILAVNICSKLSPELVQRVHQEVYEYCDRIPYNYQDLLVQTTESLISAIEVLLEKHTQSVGGSSGNGSKPGSNGSTPVKTSLFQQFEHAANNQQEVQKHTVQEEEVNEAEESDEFSDWDEDEEEETMNATDSCNNVAILTNTINLVKDMEDLYKKCIQWKEVLEQNYDIEFY